MAERASSLRHESFFELAARDDRSLPETASSGVERAARRTLRRERERGGWRGGRRGARGRKPFLLLLLVGGVEEAKKKEKSSRVSVFRKKKARGERSEEEKKGRRAKRKALRRAKKKKGFFRQLSLFFARLVVATALFSLSSPSFSLAFFAPPHTHKPHTHTHTHTNPARTSRFPPSLSPLSEHTKREPGRNAVAAEGTEPRRSRSQGRAAAPSPASKAAPARLRGVRRRRVRLRPRPRGAPRRVRGTPAVSGEGGVGGAQNEGRAPGRPAALKPSHFDELVHPKAAAASAAVRGRDSKKHGHAVRHE